jgi:anthranilate synthase component 1
MYYPSKQEFVKLAKEGNLIPVYKEIVADMETPVSAFRKIEGEYSFLLESIEGGEKIARFSFLGTSSKGQVVRPKTLAEIKALLKKYKPIVVPGLPRFHGGLVGYVGYDMVRQIEPKLMASDKNPDDLKIPAMLFLLTDTIWVFDHIKRKIIIISNADVEKEPQKAYLKACGRIDKLEKKLKKTLPPEKPIKLHISKASKKMQSNMTQKQYEAVVEKAKAYIRAGDIIQVVPSQRFEIAFKGDPFNVYRALRMINPSPYMYYLKLGNMQIAGTSPEVMVRLENGEATVRPLAGTRRRGKDTEEDKALERELLASDKERAEHIMLVDLGRNDLGRVCDYGSVRVTEEMVIERYSHVMHIVSNVSGKLQKGKDAVDLLAATFPAGTVTGAPKVRAMEIIDELENRKRGIYSGCVGYFGFSGEMDTCITIRTILFKGNKAYIQAGAGIVADSIPSQEYQETVNKAKAMFRAIELAA